MCQYLNDSSFEYDYVSSDGDFTCPTFWTVDSNIKIGTTETPSDYFSTTNVNGSQFVYTLESNTTGEGIWQDSPLTYEAYTLYQVSAIVGVGTFNKQPSLVSIELRTGDNTVVASKTIPYSAFTTSNEVMSVSLEFPCRPDNCLIGEDVRVGIRFGGSGFSPAVGFICLSTDSFVTTTTAPSSTTSAATTTAGDECVAVGDHSFEDVYVESGEVLLSSSSWTQDSQSSFRVVLAPGAVGPASTPYGDQYAYAFRSASSTAGIWQDLDIIYRPDETITFYMSIAGSDNVTYNSNPTLEFRDQDDNVLASNALTDILTTTFTEYSLEFTVPSNAAYLLQRVRIGVTLTGTGPSPALDNVRVCRDNQPGFFTTTTTSTTSTTTTSTTTLTGYCSPISVSDDDFEATTVVGGETEFVPGVWNFNNSLPFFIADESYSNAPAGTPTQYLVLFESVNDGNGVQQVLADQYAANTLYKLEADLYRTSCVSCSSIVSLEFRDANNVTIAVHSWSREGIPATGEHVTLYFKTPASASYIGSDITIAISFLGAGLSPGVDNVAVCVYGDATTSIPTTTNALDDSNCARVVDPSFEDYDVTYEAVYPLMTAGWNFSTDSASVRILEEGSELGPETTPFGSQYLYVFDVQDAAYGVWQDDSITYDSTMEYTLSAYVGASRFQEYNCSVSLDFRFDNNTLAASAEIPSSSIPVDSFDQFYLDFIPPTSMNGEPVRFGFSFTGQGACYAIDMVSLCLNAAPTSTLSIG